MRARRCEVETVTRGRPLEAGRDQVLQETLKVIKMMPNISGQIDKDQQLDKRSYGGARTVWKKEAGKLQELGGKHGDEVTEPDNDVV